MPPSEPAVVQCPPSIWRIARTGSGVRFSWINPADSVSRAGNRFDVPGGGVLYGSTEPRGCFYETLARFRVVSGAELGAAARAAANDTDLMQPGQIPRQWRETRGLFEIAVENPLQFLDIEHEATRAFLATELADDLIAHDAQQLDVSHIRGSDRLLTRRLALWAYTRVDANGKYSYSGIRYLSRHGEQECWAILDSTTVTVRRQTPIALDDANLAKVTELWGLRIH